MRRTAFRPGGVELNGRLLTLVPSSTPSTKLDNTSYRNQQMMEIAQYVGIQGRASWL
jgi:hypothetical protein